MYCNQKGGSTMVPQTSGFSAGVEEEALHDACGVAGLFQVENTVAMNYYCLHALQHRGQEAAGITCFTQDGIRVHKGFGLVTEVFDGKSLTDLGEGLVSVGHVRYATSGQNIVENIQPIVVRSHQDSFVVAHNGEITNALDLRTGLENLGSIFHGTADTEVISHIIQREEGPIEWKVAQACRKLDGSFSLVVGCEDKLIGVRDRNGFRPLCLGKLKGGHALCSESCAFEIIAADFIREIEPGEIVVVDRHGVHSYSYLHLEEMAQSLGLDPHPETALSVLPDVVSLYEAPDQGQHFCAMEFIYFSRPDSMKFGRNIHQVRKGLGRALALRDSVKVDMVVGVPDSSLSAAMGYAEARGLPYEMGIIKNRYVGRTFIKPSQAERDRGVRMKLSPVASIVRDKRILLVDDSIVRGTTSTRIVKMLFQAGAKEVHLRISAPPLCYPCHYGIDIHDRNQLASAQMDNETLRAWIGANSLEFLSLEDLETVTGGGLCTACFTGSYPTRLYQWAYPGASQGSCAPSPEAEKAE